MGQILSACEKEVISRDLEEVRAPEFKFDKREAFLRETKKFPCLRRIPELNKLADTIVASWYLEPSNISCRKWHRIPLERSIGLAMINSQTRKLESDLEIVEGRNLSIEGISFCHPSPIYSREVAVTFDLKKSVKEFLVVRLAWSRFSEKQTFQSGGKFVYQTKIKVS